MTVANIISIFIAGLLTNNVVLKQSWGICPFLGVSKKTNSAVGMGLAVTFVTTVASIVVYVIFNFVLAPLELEYLRTIVFILVIAALVQLLEIVIKKFSPTLYNSLGIYLALITTNCAVLLVANDNTDLGYNFVQSVVNGFAVGLGFTLALILMAGVRERLEKADVPKSLQGFPIALLAAAVMALAFFGFEGFRF